MRDFIHFSLHIKLLDQINDYEKKFLGNVSVKLPDICPDFKIFLSANPTIALIFPKATRN